MRLINCQIQPQRDPKLNSARSVHFEQLNGGASDISESFDLVIYLAEVFRPLVPARMEEANNRRRQGIDSGEIRTFVGVASVAGEGEVVRGSGTAMLPRDDVLDVKSRVWNRVLRKPAVFAPVCGTVAHQFANERCHGPARLLSASRALALKIPSRSSESISSSYSERSDSVSEPSAALSAKASIRSWNSASSWNCRTCSAEWRVRPAAHGTKTRSRMEIALEGINFSIPMSSGI